MLRPSFFPLLFQPRLFFINSIICSTVGCKQFLSREESCGSGSSHCWSADPTGHLMVQLIMSTAHSAKTKSVNLRFESVMVIIEHRSECRLFSECGPRSKSRSKNWKNSWFKNLNCYTWSYCKLQDFYFGLHRGLLCSRRSLLLSRKNIQLLNHELLHFFSQL